MSYVKIGVAGPVGSGKTALIEALSRKMAGTYSMGVITNDIYTKEDAEFLARNSVLPVERIIGVETGGCPHTAISFYPDSLCCIEGVKGAFPYAYDNASGMLQIDSTIFGVRTLTGLEFVIEYIETIFPEEAEEPEVPEVPEAKPDENGIILPVEYEGLIINADNKVDTTKTEVRYNVKPHKFFLFSKQTEERIRYEVK